MIITLIKPSLSSLKIADFDNDRQIYLSIAAENPVNPASDLTETPSFESDTVRCLGCLTHSVIFSDESISLESSNLKYAFSGESQANRRYLYFAKVADVEGYPEVASNFRETAEGETGHAHGHLDYLKKVGDPATDLPIGDTEQNLKAAVAGETHEYTDMYPGMAKTARQEGFNEIADWFETLAKAEKSHAGRFQQMLEKIG